MNKKFMPDMITEHVLFLSKHIKQELKNLTGEKPLGFNSIPTKVQVERWLKESQEDKFAFLQQYGPEKYMERETDMEMKKEKLDNATKRYYGIQEGINTGEV